MGVLLEQFRGGRRPNVVISGSEVEREARVGFESAFCLPPLRFGGGIVAAFDDIAHAEDELRVFGGGLLPDLLPDAGLRFAGAVA